MWLYLLAVPVVVAVVAYLVVIAYQNVRLPGEPALVSSFIPFIGSGVAFSKDCAAFLGKYRARYGDIFTLYMGGQRMHIVLDETAWDTLFYNKRKELSFEPFALKAKIRAFGIRNEVSLIPQLETESHSHYIKHLQGQGLDALSKTINEHLLKWFQSDRKLHGVGVPVKAALFDLVFRAGWDAGLMTIFGTSFVQEAPSDLLQQFRTFDSKFALLFGGAPGFAVKDAVQARTALAEYMAKENFDGSHSGLMKARQEMFAKIPQMTKLDVAQYNISILWAAHSNSLPALFWFIYYVFGDKKVAQEVQKEVDTVLEKYGIKDTLIIPREAFKEMVVLESCWQEVLRLHTGSLTVRASYESHDIPLPSGPLRVRKGDAIALFPYLHHHDPEIFENPETFIYDRFLAKDGKAPVFYKNGRKLKHSVVAFGGGVSMCPGRFFIANEVKMLAVLVVSMMDFEIDPNHKPPVGDPSRCGLGIIPPIDDVSVTYKYRA